MKIFTVVLLHFYVTDAPTVATFTTGTPGNAVVKGTTVTLTCSANGYPAPIYIIKRGATPVVSNGGKFEINNVQLGEEENEYSCETQNAEGSGPPEIKIRITVLGKDQEYLLKVILKNQPVLSIISNQMISFIPSEVKWCCVDFRGCWEGGGGGLQSFSKHLHLCT